jgi:hypothetical protein
MCFAIRKAKEVLSLQISRDHGKTMSFFLFLKPKFSNGFEERRGEEGGREDKT